MADENNPAAPAPAPAAPAPAAPPAAEPTLLDTAVKPAAADPAAPAALPSSAEPAAVAEWFWADGVKGADKPPEWFDGKKYKSVAEQAKAYPEARKELDALRGKMKSFAGAPEQYELTIPDDLKDKLEWLPDDPLLNQFQTLAKEGGMSQELFSKLLHTFAQYEYTNGAPDWAKEKEAIGDRADERLSGFWEWAESTFDDETAATVKRALGVWPSPAQIFMALEAVRSGTRQPAIHKAGDDVQTGPKSVEEINRKYRTPDPATKRALIDTPDGVKAYRAELAKLVGNGDHKEVVGQRKAG